jgi:hypothetical protein
LGGGVYSDSPYVFDPKTSAKDMKMPKSTAIQMICGLLVLIVAVSPALASDATQPMEEASEIRFKRAAVASFLVGRHQPDLDERMDETLLCPIGEICAHDPSILPQAGPALTRLVDQQLRRHFNLPVATQAAVRSAEAQMTLNLEKDTPLSLVRQLGQLLEVDMVVVGSVWRYRDRGAVEGVPDEAWRYRERTTVKGVPDSGASIGFAIYFVDVASGQTLWRGIYDATQQTVLEDLFQAGKQIRMGLRWLSADELAAHGVQEVFRRLPQPPQPACGVILAE